MFTCISFFFCSGQTGQPVSQPDVETTNQMPQPPPYSEVANQTAVGVVAAANQNPASQNQNQSAVDSTVQSNAQ